MLKAILRQSKRLEKIIIDGKKCTRETDTLDTFVVHLGIF
jgi:hypothetical protein